MRWIWPGEIGLDIIEQDRIAFSPFEYRYHPQIRSRDGVFAYSRLTTGGYGRSREWVRLQRLQLDSLTLPAQGHGFGDWWNRFNETNPEYFALQPDGTRSGFPSPSHAKICKSNPDDNVIVTSVANFLLDSQMADRGSPQGTLHRDQFDKWSQVAPNLAWRPNKARRMGSKPHVPIKHTIENFRFAAENNCIGIHIDYVWEHWATRGPFYYVMAQMGLDYTRLVTEAREMMIRVNESDGRDDEAEERAREIWVEEIKPLATSDEYPYAINWGPARPGHGHRTSGRYPQDLHQKW